MSNFKCTKSNVNFSFIKDETKFPTWTGNREVFERARSPKFRKAMQTNSPKKYEYSVGVFPDGTSYLFDGNTRREYYKNVRPELAPNEIVVHFYEVQDDNDAEELYLSFDNSIASKKREDFFTGAFRKYNLVLKHKDIALAKGAFKTGVTHALVGCPHVLNKNDPDEIVRVFEKEIITLSNLKWVKHPNLKTYRPAFVAASLMVLKKYGTTNKLLLEGLNRLVSYNDGKGPGESNNPIDVILRVWQKGGDAKYQIHDVQSTAYDNPKIQLNFILYCFYLYMKGETLGKFTQERQRDLSSFIHYDEFWSLKNKTELSHFQKYGKKYREKQNQQSTLLKQSAMGVVAIDYSRVIANAKAFGII